MAQIGGRFAFESVSLPVNGRISALGGHHIAVKDSDVAMSLMNPALSNESMHHHLSINHNFHFAGISNGHIVFGQHLDSLGISTHFAFSFLDYGDFDRSDETGEINGEFGASEVAFLAGFGKQLNERIRAGVNLKFMNGSYESYGSFGLGMDIGLFYQRPGSLSSWAIVLSNMGSEINAIGEERRALDFDLQIAFAKKLEHLPFRFSIIARELGKWDIRFNDPDGDIRTDFTGAVQEKSAFDKAVDNFFRHLVFNGEFLIGSREQFRLRMAYNHLRRQEMRLSNFRSLAGFSFGFGFNIKRIKFDYGIGYYHLAGANNHLSLRMNLDEIFRKI